MIPRAARRVLGALLAVSFLTGCAADRPAPVVDRSIGVAKREPQVPPDVYEVRRGDTLYSIAFRYGLDFKTLARWNDIATPYTIYPGQEIRFEPPPAADDRAGRTEPVRTRGTSVEIRPLPEAEQDPAPAREPAAGPAPVPAPETREQPAGPAPEKPAEPAAETAEGPLAWQWPADGSLLSTFAAGDSSRNGIDIGGQSGDPVRAAAGGEVVYSGSGLIGYGELIIVKHDNALLSAYGHNRKRLVQEGDRVQAGQRIAELGQTGAPKPMLHFEIREDGKPVDPMKYLPER